MIFIKKVQQIIQSNLNNPLLKGQMIADKLGISRMHLHRKLKAHTSLHARGYILSIRIAYAKGELRNSAKPVFIIAQECGFSGYTYFSKVFKEKTGYSPTAFRE